MCPFLYVIQPVFSFSLKGALQDSFCNGVMFSDVAKPGELASFHCCQQGLLLSSKGVHLSHIFICLVVWFLFEIRRSFLKHFVSNVC